MNEYENTLSVGEAIEEFSKQFGLPDYEEICKAKDCCEHKAYGYSFCAKHAEVAVRLFKGIKALHAKHRALKGIK